MIVLNQAVYRLKGKDQHVHKNHSHNEIEIIHVITGNGMILKNDKTYSLQPQTIFVVDGRNAHIIHPFSDDCLKYERSKIVMDSQSFEAFCRYIHIDNLLDKLYNSPPISTEDCPEIDLLYQKICDMQHSNQKEISGFVHAYILQIIHWISTHIENQPQPFQNSIIQKILDIISEKDGVTSLNEISEILYLNKYYVCHMFKTKTGRNFSDYLTDKVFEKAVKLLQCSTNSIEEIALQCGFSASSSFSRFFKNKSGISPSQFRSRKNNIRNPSKIQNLDSPS